MRLVPVWALRPGMEVAKKVTHGKNASLLNAGVKLQIEYIQQLKKLNISAIYVHDHLIPDVEIEDVILEQTRDKAVNLVQRALIGMQDDSLKNYSHLFNLKSELFDVLDDIVGQLLNTDNLVLNLADIRHTDNYTFSHSVNVAVLSIMTSISMGLSRSQLKDIGMGAFLHDLGKVVIPVSILNKPGRLSEDEMTEMMKHPVYGMELVKARHIFNGPSISIIYKHHERVDGSGYPLGLQEDEVDIYPKICAVADVYDALVSDRPYRPGFKPHRALEIMEEEAEKFELQVMQKFYHNVSAYPVGTFVGLNDGYIGVVVKNTHGHPTRPCVRVICRKDDYEPLEQFEIDLLDDLKVVVDRVYEDHEIPSHIYYRESS
ncbi:MAG: HD-GYP domain-containing protein [Bacillota bacterium]